MNNPLVSVIIPIYNVEKFVAECLNSITSQTYHNLEILCVNDHGSDNSMNIIESLATKDKRIKILDYGKNMGVSQARNYGIENSNGNFIYFIDSDDFIDLDYIGSMVKNVADFDILQNNNFCEYRSENNKKLVKLKNKISPNIWNKFYKSDFLIKNNIRFPTGIKMGEDLHFNYNCQSLTDNIGFVNLSNYYYRQSENSAVKRLRSENDILDMFHALFKTLKDNKALDKLPMPLNHLRRHMDVAENRTKMFYKIRNFFIEIKPFLTNIKIYNKKDLVFFNSIVNSNSYYEYRIRFLIGKIFK